MERLIWVTWRAFWIGLGASLVLIAQSFAPVKVSVMPRDEVKIAPKATPAPAPTPTIEKSAEPILSRNPFDSKTGRSSVASLSGCRSGPHLPCRRCRPWAAALALEVVAANPPAGFRALVLMH
jgi:hypothetical protein